MPEAPDGNAMPSIVRIQPAGASHRRSCGLPGELCAPHPAPRLSACGCCRLEVVPVIHDDVLSAIGRTPLVRLRRVVPPGGAEVLAKLEFFAPGGSVKDRAALAMVDEAERRGVLRSGATIVEASAGNTGVGLALVCAVRGYRCIIVVPDSTSR